MNGLPPSAAHRAYLQVQSDNAVVGVRANRHLRRSLTIANPQPGGAEREGQNHAVRKRHLAGGAQ